VLGASLVAPNRRLESKVRQMIPVANGHYLNPQPWVERSDLRDMLPVEKMIELGRRFTRRVEEKWVGVGG